MRHVLAGVVIGVAMASAAWACGIVVRPARIPLVVSCQIDALKVLPPELGMVTVCDAADIWERVHACRAPDAGTL
jgi:hypothetical protein